MSEVRIIIPDKIVIAIISNSQTLGIRALLSSFTSSVLVDHVEKWLLVNYPLTSNAYFWRRKRRTNIENCLSEYYFAVHDKNRVVIELPITIRFYEINVLEDKTYNGENEKKS